MARPAGRRTRSRGRHGDHVLRLEEQAPWPAALTWNSLAHYLDNFQAWLSNNRNVPHPSIFFRLFNGIATFLDDLVGWLTSFFFKLTWAGTTALGTLVVLRFGGRRAALGIVLAAFVSSRLLGVWDPSMQTFALTFASVGLSLAIGMPLGVLAGRSDRFQRIVTPVLDAMQIIPAFAYLMPIVILFSVGPGAAVATTLIYAIPPAIRITALGIRGVPTNTVEAAEALGATRLQTLLKVQLPLARRMLLLVGEPDDPVRPLDGRDRRADRRAGPRRRRHERPLLRILRRRSSRASRS